MMELWNQKDLALPPINTYKAVKTTIDIKHLHNVFREGIEFFKNEKFLYAEHVVLSRMVYRMKLKFRSSKDFKALQKLSKALKNYFNMNITLSLNKFLEIIPCEYKKKLYLPTKNLLDYILVRLQGIVKLMERIVETSKIAAYLLDMRMHTGHFWKIAFLAYALVSRVYIVARYTTKFVCDFYRKVLPFSSQLKNTGNEWLPQNYNFPKDLQEWMNVDWLEFDDEVQIIEAPTDIPDVMKLFDLVDDDDDDVQISDEYFMVNDDDDDDEEVRNRVINDPRKKTFLEELGELRGFDNKEDTGEVIEIEDGFREYADTAEANITEYSERTDNNSSAIQQPSQLTSLIHLVDESITNALNQEGNVTMSSIAAFAKNHSESYDKNTLENALCKLIDSNSSTSINESDEDVRVSDESVIVVPDNQIITATIVDSDEDVLTVSDSSLLEIPAKLIKQKRKKPRKNVERKLEYSSCEDTVIIVPDTPLPKQSGVSAVLSADDDTVVVVDTPRKSLKKQKNLIRKNTMVGKTFKRVNNLNDSENYVSGVSAILSEDDDTVVIVDRPRSLKEEENLIPKNTMVGKTLKRVNNLNDSKNYDSEVKHSNDGVNLKVSISKKQKKKLKNKAINLGLNTENIQRSGNLSQCKKESYRIQSSYTSFTVAQPKIIKENKIIKVKNEFNKSFKRNSKKLKLASKNLPENSNLVRQSTHIPLTNQKNQENIVLINKDAQISNHKKRKPNSLDHNNQKKIKLVDKAVTESNNLVNEHAFIPLNNQSSQNSGVPRDKNLRKRKFKKGKSRRNALDLTSNTKKLKLAVTTSAENGNLVNRNTHIPLGFKKRQEGDISINKNSNVQSLKKIKLEPNSFNPNNNKQELYVNTIPEETNKDSKSSFKADASSKLHLANKSKKTKKKKLVGNKQQGNLSSSMTDKTTMTSKINMSHTKKIHMTGKNIKKEMLDINTTKADQNTSNTSKKSKKKKNRIHKNDTLNLNKTEVLQNLKDPSHKSENQSGSSLQNNSSINIKKEVCWEDSNEKQQFNNSIGFSLANIKKEKNPDISMEPLMYIPRYFPQASSTPKIDVVYNNNNPQTVQIKGNNSKKNKKKSKVLNSLAQSNISLKKKKKNHQLNS